MTPEVREAQRITTQTTPNTAMAVTTDIGEAADIHPKQKQPIGAGWRWRAGFGLWRSSRILGTSL